MEAIEDLDRDETVKKSAVRARGNGAANGSGDSKQKAIAHAVSTIEKQFGKGAILTMTADGIDREIERRAMALTALLEPTMILVMGGVVLTIVLAVLMPIMEMNQLVR